ncbi:MAG: hypothetical protein E6Q97_08175 [Desulfurellales bacterium]|nr:MAG: hypothetical protein E6Q97_08175 [Desulfurellales bacterium]
MPDPDVALDKLYKHILGGTNPPGAASSTGDIGQLIKYLVANLPAGEPMPPIIGPHSSFALGAEIAAAASGAASQAAWSSANRAFGYPFRVTRTWTAVKGFYYAGTTASGNVDIGIYTDAYAKIVSKGSTAHVGAGEVIEVDIADTPISPGLYYAVLAVDNTTAQFTNITTGDSRLLEALGCFVANGAFALPATITPAAVGGAVANIPIFGFSNRALVT